MANGRTHAIAFNYSLILFIPVFIALGVFYSYTWFYYIPLLLLSNSMVDPDEDQKWAGGSTHRNFLTHSVLWSLIIAIVIMITAIPFMTPENLLDWSTRMFAVFTIPVILHSFLDIYSPTGNRVGKYNIRVKRGHRLSGTGTILWFVVNIILMLAFDVWLFLS